VCGSWLLGNPLRARGKLDSQQRGRPTNCTNGEMTLCPSAERTRNPDNLLIIKGLKTNFSPPNPDNILKRNPLTMNPKKRILGCKMPDIGDAKLLLSDARKVP